MSLLLLKEVQLLVETAAWDPSPDNTTVMMADKYPTGSSGSVNKKFILVSSYLKNLWSLGRIKKAANTVWNWLLENHCWKHQWLCRRQYDYEDKSINISDALGYATHYSSNKIFPWATKVHWYKEWANWFHENFSGSLRKMHLLCPQTLQLALGQYCGLGKCSVLHLGRNKPGSSINWGTTC